MGEIKSPLAHNGCKSADKRYSKRNNIRWYLYHIYGLTSSQVDELLPESNPAHNTSCLMDCGHGHPRDLGREQQNAERQGLDFFSSSDYANPRYSLKVSADNTSNNLPSLFHPPILLFHTQETSILGLQAYLLFISKSYISYDLTILCLNTLPGG